jgi:hypothetical protein
MYKIMCSIDGKTRVQYFTELQGKRYGSLYLTEATAQHVVNSLTCIIDEDGGGYQSPTNYWVERAEPHDFKTQRQCVVILCRYCGAKIDNNLDPIPTYSKLANLLPRWVIDPDDFAHDPGCESVRIMAILKLPIIRDKL